MDAGLHHQVSAKQSESKVISDSMANTFPTAQKRTANITRRRRHNKHFKEAKGRNKLRKETNLTRRSSRLRGAAGAPRHRPGWHKRPDCQASAVVVLRLPRRPRSRVHSNQLAAS
jgi:hypothetical protein